MAGSASDDNSLLCIGNRLVLSDFIGLPNLYGHSMCKIGNQLVVTGGIGNDSEYCSTFCFVVPCLDEIIGNAISGYLEIVSNRYLRATQQQKQSEHGSFGGNKVQKKQKQKQQQQKQSQSHSNQRFKKGNASKNKGKKKKQKPKQKDKKMKKGKQQKKSKQQSNDLIVHDNVYKDVMRTVSNETIKLDAQKVIGCMNGNEDKWIFDIGMCSFCCVIELYCTQNKWLRIRNIKNDGVYRFCSLKCQDGFKEQQTVIHDQLRQYRKQRMLHKLQQQQAAE